MSHNKMKRVVVVIRRVVMAVMGGLDENVKEMDEKSGKEIETVRKASNTKLDALGEETVN